MNTIKSEVEIAPESIFDSLAQTVTKELGPDEMTRGRFAEKYGVSIGGAISVLEKAVKEGKLRKEGRNTSNGANGSHTTVYIPTSQ